uniref:Uncharacterized protein n=1 Tax=Pithovirus LCPAC404 TaxID=2506597 RepID=A0A481ZD07_9VIRU|nr:MAG: uncharacterized protein LCPAC404_02600 [Pithovirus LCPAC404]
MESRCGLIFIKSSDDIGIFTRIFCKYSYIGVWILRETKYTVILINPFVFIEPKRYEVDNLKDLTELKGENIDEIYTRECTLSDLADRGKELGFSGYLTSNDSFSTVITALLTEDCIGVEAINDLLGKIYSHFTFKYTTIRECEIKNEIFKPLMKIGCSIEKTERKTIPRSIMINVSNAFNINNVLEKAFNSIDMSDGLRHIRLDILVESLQYFYSIFHSKQNDTYQRSLIIPEEKGSYPAVVSIGSEDRNIQIEFTNGKKFVLTTNSSEMKILTKQQRTEVLEIMNVISDGSLFYENIRRQLEHSI